MSGIINSAGSKSGVIGTTELDYEEGTFTPVIADATSGGNSISAGTAEGMYVKVGNLCIVQLFFYNIADPAGLTSGNNLYIRTLPFTSKPNNKRSTSIPWLDGVGFNGYPAAIIPESSISVYFKEITNGAADVTLKCSALATNDDIIFSITYTTA